MDLLRLRDRLEPAERARLDAIEDHLQTRVRPHLTRYWDAEEFAFASTVRVLPAAIAYLALSVQHQVAMSAHRRHQLYEAVEFIGRWSMVDIFVVAILAALIRADALMTITPGPAALAFASVVVLTMLAAITFDPRLLWETPVLEPSDKEARHA